MSSHKTYSDADVSNVLNSYGAIVDQYLKYYPRLTKSRVLGHVLIESGGDTTAIGDGGSAYGLGQVHQDALTDFNNFYSKNYTLQDLLTPYKGLEVLMGYLNLKYWDMNENLDKASEAYNQGEQNADDAKGKEYLSMVLVADADVLKKMMGS